MSLLGWIGNFLSGGAISAIGKQVNEWQRIKEQAKNDHERLLADQALASLEAQKTIIGNAQKDKYERWVRIGFALPFIIYNAKLVVWDKVLGLGVTDPLSTDLIQIQTVVLAGYFAYAIIRNK